MRRISLRRHLYIATKMILKGHGHLNTRAGSCQLQKKKQINCKAAVNWTIDCMVYAWWVLLCRSWAMSMPMATNPIYRPDRGGTWQ